MTNMLESKSEFQLSEAFNFIASWQLFPEKGSYEFGHRPKSGIYRIEKTEVKNMLTISMNWVSVEDQAFSSRYSFIPDGTEQSIADNDIADIIQSFLIDATNMKNIFHHDGKIVLEVSHEITPRGFLKVTQKHYRNGQQPFTNVEIFHKQMSVLPYSSSVSGALVKPNEEGIIRHHALTAMEEQTHMQLAQIRQQIELLAIQAREIHQRKELSLIIYNAKLSFNPVIGQTYYLYEKEDGSHLVSLVGPKEWGVKIPFKDFVAAVKLLADHTWKEV